MFRTKQNECDLSVIVVFYNMQREAERTLYSLTRAYQRNLQGITYEVIALDNGSNENLDKTWVESFGSNFQYFYFKTAFPSPCAALNYGAEIAKGKLLTICIDGARILSPGILGFTMSASRLHNNPFIYTLSMHIGTKLQNELVEQGYSQKDEDLLMAAVNWKENGYLLFDISCVAPSSGNGYLSRLKESNCITISRSTFGQIGGFDERFTSAGGGLANLDFFNRANEMEDIYPVMLLGEATFHQFHGGTATNVPRKDHPWDKMHEEYTSIRGKPYKPHNRMPVYFGNVDPVQYHLLQPTSEWDKQT